MRPRPDPHAYHQTGADWLAQACLTQIAKVRSSKRHRRQYAGQRPRPHARNKPSAKLLHPARGHRSWFAVSRERELILRMEASCGVLECVDRRPRSFTRGVELSRPEPGVRDPAQSCRFLRRAVQALQHRRAAGQSSARQLHGGWITPHLAGPFKGAAGSMGW